MLPNNKRYISAIHSLHGSGTMETCRGFHTVEELNSTIVFDMNQPLITLSNRKLGYRFACAEAAWILSGDNRVSTIKPYSKQIEHFSDDGMLFYGAYGPKIVDQLSYVIKALADDTSSRQAVLNIWREKPGKSKDIPCTLSAQFMIRNDKLHVINTMRSSDIWLGVPYDLFNFSMLAAYVAIALKEYHNKKVDLGDIYMNAGSRHFYMDESDFGYGLKHITDVIINGTIEDFSYKPINLDLFNDPEEIVDHLWNLAKFGFSQEEGNIPGSFLTNEMHVYYELKRKRKQYEICQGE